MATKKPNRVGKKIKFSRLTKEDTDHLFGKSPSFPKTEEALSESVAFGLKLDSYEEVVHPKHYNGLPNGVECWDVVEHFPTNVGSAIKYLWRAGQKPGQDTVKDLKKALQWTQRQIDLLEGKNPNMGIRG